MFQDVIRQLDIVLELHLAQSASSTGADSFDAGGAASRDLDDDARAGPVTRIIQENAITPDSIDSFTVEYWGRYI